MARSISGKTAQRCERRLLRTDCRDTHRLERFPRKLCKLAGKEAIRPLPMAQICEARSYFSQVRIIIHVIAATPSGTIPTSKFFPSHGKATICRRVSQLKAPLPKINPACNPIGSHNEWVCTRATARMQPKRNNVAKANASIIGSSTRPNAWAIEFKPEIHVTMADVRSGALKKWTAAKTAETTRMATYFRPVLSKTPKTMPRKNASSMNGTAIEATSTLPRRGQAKVCRNE